MQEKTRRGRPPKKVVTPDSDFEVTPEEKPQTVSSGASGGGQALRSRQPGTPCLRVRRMDGSVFLDMVDDRGRAVNPDYRRFEGDLRELFREFTAVGRRTGTSFVWGGGPGGQNPRGGRPSRGGIADSASCVESSAHLLKLGLRAGILVDQDLARLEAVPESDRLVVHIENSGGVILARPLPFSIVEEDNAGTGAGSGTRAFPDAESAGASGAAGAAAISPCHVLHAGRIHEVPDLGPSWRELDGVPAFLKPEDLHLHLSVLVSRFSSIEPHRAGYEILRKRASLVRCALLFREIDAYGYLHVRPFGHVEGLPPGFLEDGEISRIVTLDEDSRTITVSDLLFPRFADEEFRRILSASGREARTAVFEEAGRFILDPAFAERFLSANMRELMATFALYEADRLTRYRILATRPRLRFKTVSGIDFLGGEVEIEIGGESVPYEAFITEYGREGCVTLSTGIRAYPEARDVARYERLLKRVSATARGKAAPLFRVASFDLPLLEREATIDDPGKALDAERIFYSGYNRMAKAGDEPSIHGGELRSYQDYGARWIGYLADHGRHGCLADEMGLGKTVQTIAALRSWLLGAGQSDGHPGSPSSGEERGPVLIVMPRSLLFNWQSELARFAPEFSILVHHGTDRAESLVQYGSRPDQVILTSYATLRNDLELFLPLRFSWLVLDESQSVKNAATQSRAAVASLRASHRLALSGTPVENHLGELWSLFEFLEPGFFGDSADFTRRWKAPIEEGDQDALKDLRARIYPFMLRRRKAEVLSELPPRTEQTSLVELEPGHHAVYHRRRLELKAAVDRALDADGIGKSGMLILAAMTELRRLATVPEADGLWQGVSAKRMFLREIIPELVETGHKALIFTNWLACVEFVSEDLSGLGIGNLAMTGATVDRQGLVDRFRSDPAIGVFTMTLKTGGLGLNLTAADYVFLLDPWWNRAAEAQAIDRTHRIGQVNPVFCYRLIAKDTIEERLLELQERKAGLVAGLLASDADAMKRLDEDDIAYLLG